MHGFRRWQMHYREDGRRVAEELGPMWPADAQACERYAVDCGLGPTVLIELPDEDVPDWLLEPIPDAELPA